MCHRKFLQVRIHSIYSNESLVIEKYSQRIAKVDMNLVKTPRRRTDKVQLCQSRPYMLKKAEDQAAFYRLIAKLLWYLASGKSHLGYFTIVGKSICREIDKS